MGVETLAIAAAVSTIVGAGITAYGQYQSAQSQRQASRYQQQVAALNAQTAQRNQALAERNAAYAEAAGARQIEDRGRRIRATIGAQRAALASNGLALDDGTGLDLQDDTAALGGLAIAEIRDGAARQGAGFRIQGFNAGDEAAAASARGQMYGSAASAAGTAGWLAAGGSILGGATSTFDRWSDMRRTGAVNNNPPPVMAS